MTDAPASRDPARATLAVLFIAGLIVASFRVLQPFLLAAVWATMIVVATWPLMLRVESALGGRRRLAVAVMTAVLLLGLILPLALALGTIVVHADDIAGWSRSLATWSMPPPPDWLVRLPLAGPRLAAKWQEAAAIEREELATRVAPYTQQMLGWFVVAVGSIGVVLVQFLLVVLFSAILYASGETAAEATRRFTRRVAGRHG